MVVRVNVTEDIVTNKQYHAYHPTVSINACGQY